MPWIVDAQTTLTFPALPASEKASDWPANLVHPNMKTRLFGVISTAACLVFAVSLMPALRGAGDELAQLRTQAQKGNTLAQYNLGLACAEGNGAPKDLVEAYVWLQLASENGGARTELARVLDQMSAEQVMAAKIRLDEVRRNLGKGVAVQKSAPNAAVIQQPPVVASPSSGDAELTALRDAISVLRADNARLTQQLASLQAGRIKPVVSAPADQNERNQLEAQLEAERKELSETRKANEDFAVREKELKAGQEALKRQMAEAQLSIEELKKENAALKVRHGEPSVAAAPAVESSAAAVGGPDEVAALKAELGRAESEVQMTVRSYALLKQENEQLKAQIAQGKVP